MAFGFRAMNGRFACYTAFRAAIDHGGRSPLDFRSGTGRKGPGLFHAPRALTSVGTLGTPCVTAKWAMRVCRAGGSRGPPGRGDFSSGSGLAACSRSTPGGCARDRCGSSTSGLAAKLGVGQAGCRSNPSLGRARVLECRHRLCRPFFAPDRPRPSSLHTPNVAWGQSRPVSFSGPMHDPHGEPCALGPQSTPPRRAVHVLLILVNTCGGSSVRYHHF